MSGIREIRSALETRLASVSGSPQIGWDNTEFEPPAGEVILLAHLLRGETVSRTLGTPELTMEQGIFQVSVLAPRGSGSKSAEDVADAVREHFPKGLSLSSGGLSVRIARRGSVTPARQDGAWHRIDVSIPYFCHVFHPT